MFRLYITLLFICAAISSVTGASAEECAAKSDQGCKACLSLSGCAYCKDDKVCFKYKATDTKLPCKISQLQAHTCVGTLEIWIIVGSVLGGVFLIAVIVVICCIRRRCRARRALNNYKEDSRNQQRLEERRNAAEVRSSEREQKRDAIRMKYGLLKDKFGENSYELRLAMKTCHSQWYPSLSRNLILTNRRQLATAEGSKKSSKSKDNHTLVESTKADTQIEVATFKEKAQQAAKDTGYSLVVIAGVATLGGLGYLILHELYSRETPNGIYKEASKMCLNNTEVQDALGTPILVHTTPQIGSMRINNVRAKIFEEKGHKGMTLAFYLTGKERSGVVAVKVQKNISNKYVYDYIIVQLDRPWRGRNIIQVHQNLDPAKLQPQTIDV